MTNKQQGGNNQFVAFNEQLLVRPLRRCKVATCWLNITADIIPYLRAAVRVSTQEADAGS